MKNLLIYISPNKIFDEETSVLAKIQIDNLLSLKWNPKDIYFVTNFDYEYEGVRSLVLGDENFCLEHPVASKIYTVVDLFKKGMIKDDLYWLHDFDSYQLEPVSEEELNLGSYDYALSDYGRKPSWCTASVFFKKSTGDIFEWLKQTVDVHHVNDEVALTILTQKNYNNINSRVKRLNITYNFNNFNVQNNYKYADKPIRNVHFHLARNKIDFFMYGKNKIGRVFLSERLTAIFNKHGIK